MPTGTFARAGGRPRSSTTTITTTAQSGQSPVLEIKREAFPPTPTTTQANSYHHPHSAPSTSSTYSSASSKSHFTVKSEELLDLFECPVCFDFAIPPLLQCNSGHMVCQPCREKLLFCPTCRGPSGNVRNLAMEKVALTLSFPCRYSNYDCKEKMPHTRKLLHEEDCEYRPYSCPCPGAACRWLGKIEQVIPHLLTSHKSITTLQGEDIVFLATDISLPGAVDWVMMQSCFGHYFMLILEKQEKVDGSILFYAVVQFVGNRKDAQKYGYRLELQVQNVNGTRRRLLWESTPKSIHEGVNQAFFSKDCLMFDSNSAHLFAENGNLGINVTLSQHFP